MFLFSRELQQLTIDWKKRDVNVYRSKVKITAYNSHGYQITRQISVLEIFCRARISFLFKYFVKKVLFSSLCFALRSLPPAKANRIQSLQNPVLIICAVGSLKVASTTCTTKMERGTPLTVTWIPNWTLHGLWWCHGAPQIESSQRLWNTPSTTTPHKTRTPLTGIFTA